MRRILTLVIAAAALPPLIGCSISDLIRRRDPSGGGGLPAAAPTGKADVASLVNYLNQNARRVQSIQANVDIDAKQGRQPLSLSGALAARGPRDFRLRARVLGSPVVDIGSNNDQFWYWISKANPPYYYFCTYKDLATGKVNVPFPVDTHMVLAALNMSEYDAPEKGKYEVKHTRDTIELTQDAVSPSGQEVKRVTVFRGQVAKAPEPQVTEHLLRDVKGTMICRATVHKVEVDRSGAVVPTRVTLEWPSQQVSMKLMLSDLQVNRIDKEGGERMFTLSTTGHDLFDLARGAVVSPSSLRQASPSERR